MINKDVILDFKFPNCLDHLLPEFYFDDSVSTIHSKNAGCHIESGSVKFHVYSPLINESIFIMDFYVRNKGNKSNLFRIPPVKVPNIRLQYIYTNPKFRNQGISKYYMEKLCNFTSSINIDTITINIAPSGKNGMNKEQLYSFYHSFNSDKIQIQTF